VADAKCSAAAEADGDARRATDALVANLRDKILKFKKTAKT
jgi:hypothetical protein